MVYQKSEKRSKSKVFIKMPQSPKSKEQSFLAKETNQQGLINDTSLRLQSDLCGVVESNPNGLQPKSDLESKESNKNHYRKRSLNLSYPPGTGAKSNKKPKKDEPKK